MKRYSLNRIGLAEVRLFTAAYHKRFHILGDAEIFAMASAVEKRLEAGLDPIAVISARDCVMDEEREHCIKAAGIDFEEFDDPPTDAERFLVEVRIDGEWFDSGWNGGDDFETMGEALRAVEGLNHALGWPVDALRVRAA